MSSVSTGRTLRRLREAAGLRANDVGEAISRQGKTVNAWENGRGEPDIDALITLSALFGARNILAEIATDRFGEKSPISAELTAQEQKLITRFRSLDDFGKRAVTLVTETEAERVKVTNESLLRMSYARENLARETHEREDFARDGSAAGIQAPETPVRENAAHETITLEALAREGIASEAATAGTPETLARESFIRDFDTRDNATHEIIPRESVQENIPARTIPLVKHPFFPENNIDESMIYETTEFVRVTGNLARFDADFAVRIDGAGYEPRFSSGDVLLIKRQDNLQIGDIGLVTVDGRVLIRGNAHNRLISISPGVEDIPLDNSHTVRFIGKIIAKA